MTGLSYTRSVGFEGSGRAAGPPRPGWTLALAGMGAFISALDVVVVATALPVMQARLGASLADLEWTINAYNLVFGCLMLTGAALGDRFGRRRMYVTGLTTFVAGSSRRGPGHRRADRRPGDPGRRGGHAAAADPRADQRRLPARQARRRHRDLGRHHRPRRRRGPVVGGAVVQGLSWQWIFWINVPVGLAVAALSAARLRESRGTRPQLDIDRHDAGRGRAVRADLGAGAGARRRVGQRRGDRRAGRGGVLMAGFLAWERRSRYPMLPLAYFRRRGFATANAVIFFQFTSLIGSLFFITQLFQIGLGYSPLAAGLRILVWMAMPMLVAPVAGALADRIGNRPFMVGGLILQAAGLGWLAAVVAPGVGYGALVAPLVIAGVGIAMCFPTVANLVTGSVPPAGRGAGGGDEQRAERAGRRVRRGGARGGVRRARELRHAGYVHRRVPQAEATAAALAAVGIVAAALAPGKEQTV